MNKDLPAGRMGGAGRVCPPTNKEGITLWVSPALQRDCKLVADAIIKNQHRLAASGFKNPCYRSRSAILHNMRQSLQYGKKPLTHKQLMVCCWTLGLKEPPPLPPAAELSVLVLPKKPPQRKVCE